MSTISLGGTRRETTSSVTVRAPWDGAVVGACGQADAPLANEAVALAAKTFPVTSRLPAWVRRAFLDALVAQVTTHRAALGDLIAREAGKPITLALAEVDRARTTFQLSAEACSSPEGELLSLDRGAPSAHSLGACVRVPVGPVLAITPFNFPLNLVAHKLGPAFAVGAPVVLKPAPQCPLTAMMLADLVAAACDAVPDVPKGILSVLPCANDVAESMVRDPRLAALSFTGSASVGWSLRDLAGRKRVLLELGGNAAAIVARDADLDLAATSVTSAGYGYAGQVCIKTQRVFVQRDVADAFREALLKRVRDVTVADPLDAKTLCGPLIDERSAKRVIAWVDEAVAAGARVTLGGAREGNRVTPTVIEGAGVGMKVHDEEVFGPVVTLHPYDTTDEAVAGVNASRYGLQAAVFSDDMRVIRAAFAGLDVGAVIVNDGTNFRVDAMPYGGVKDSGVGREGVRYAIEELTDRKLLVLKGFLRSS